MISFQTESQPRLQAAPPGWSLVNTSAVRQVVYYAGTEEPFLDVTFTIRLQRLSKSWVKFVLIPTFVTTILAILSTLVPHHLPGVRLLVLLITINITFFLTWSKESQTGILGNLILSSYFFLFILILHSILVITFTSTKMTDTSSDTPDRATRARLADFLVTSSLLIILVLKWTHALL